MKSNSKNSLKNSAVSKEEVKDEKNDFLQKSNQSLGKSHSSNGEAKVKQHTEDDVLEENERQNEGEILADSREMDQGNLEGSQEPENFQDQVQEQDQVRQGQSSSHSRKVPSPKNSHARNHTEFLQKQEPESSASELKTLLKNFKNELKTLQLSTQRKENAETQKKMSQLETNIEILEIKIRLQQKLKNRKELISFERINHLELIFKHYCTHIFKTGKHMTFDRLQYEKVHLTIDRLSVFLKDFNLTTLKMKDNKVREIIEKQEIIKLFKKISPNCRDLDFQQFILILERLAELYFDCKITYEQRKINQRKERLKIKQVLEKKQKYKQEMLKKHQQKIQRLEKGIVDPNEAADEKVKTQGGQNDELIEKMINQGAQEADQDKQSQVSKQTKNQNITKGKKSASLYSRAFKKDMEAQLGQKNDKESPLSLTKQEKVEYFYEIINVDDIQSFSNKMRELNLPLFKIYAGKQQNAKRQSVKDQRPDGQITAIQGSKVQTDDQKSNIFNKVLGLKELREKLSERNQKLKQSSVPSLTKEEYELRKLKRSRLQEEAEGSVKVERKAKKVDLTEGEINLSSLSKLAYENVNFSKFNPKAFYKKEEDDDIFLQQYGDSPVRNRKPQLKTEVVKYSQNSNRIFDEKEKNTENMLQKLKQRQSQLEINQKKEEVSQMYRFNDRTQRQKRLIDKFLEKNK